MSGLIEIERKFLLRDASWKKHADRSVRILQGYLCREPDNTVRIRIAGNSAWITIKGRTSGITRSEIEFAVDPAMARQALDLFCSHRLEKVRYYIDFSGHTWEIDEFAGSLNGLVVAEIELKHENEEFIAPPWLGREVTHDHRYSNSNLADLNDLGDLPLF
jgi:adenylate cyclase